jgi:hypothetical protein
MLAVILLHLRLVAFGRFHSLNGGAAARAVSENTLAKSLVKTGDIVR